MAELELNGVAAMAKELDGLRGVIDETFSAKDMAVLQTEVLRVRNSLSALVDRITCACSALDVATARLAVCADGAQRSYAAARVTMQTVAQHFGYSANYLASEGRHEELKFARHLAMWCVHTYDKLSFKEIAPLFDRDYTSVRYGVKWVEARVSQDKVKSALSVLEGKLEGKSDSVEVDAAKAGHL